MKLIRLTIAAITLMFGSILVYAMDNKNTESVTAAANNLYAGIAAKNLAAISPYIPDDGFTELSPDSNDWHRLTLKDFAGIFASSTQVNFHIKNLQVQMHENFAVITGTRVGSITPSNSAPIETSFLITMVWSKSKAGWQLNHVHLSAPAVSQ